MSFWIRTLQRPDHQPGKPCLLKQLSWPGNNDNRIIISNSWLGKVKAILAVINEDTLISCTQPKKIAAAKDRIISEYAIMLTNCDVKRMLEIKYIPHYKFIKTNATIFNYLNINLALHTVRLMAQMCLKKYRIKLGTSYMKLETRSPLCTSFDPNSILHYLFLYPDDFSTLTVILQEYLTFLVCCFKLFDLCT